jgi:hypothetical protein
VIRQFNRQTFRDLQLDTNPADLNGDGVRRAENIYDCSLDKSKLHAGKSICDYLGFDEVTQLEYFETMTASFVRSYIDEEDSSDDGTYALDNFLDEGIQFSLTTV